MLASNPDSDNRTMSSAEVYEDDYEDEEEYDGEVIPSSTRASRRPSTTPGFTEDQRDVQVKTLAADTASPM